MTDTERERAVGAILGAFVGDAACLGLHWIYDPEEVAERGGELPEFQAPLDDHYHAGRRPGDPTHYGDHAFCLLASLVECGELDLLDYGRRVGETFGEGYDGYVDHATEGTLANLRGGAEGPEAGADDDQVGAAAKLPPLVVRYLHHPEQDAVVEKAIRVTHANPVAVAHGRVAARAMAAVVAGASLEEAVERAIRDAPREVRERVDEARGLAGDDPVEAAGTLGRACALPESLPSAIQAALHAEDYAAAIRGTILASGDSAGRAMIVGALHGALGGGEAIPEAWVDRLRRGDEIRQLASRLVEQAEI